MTYKQALELGGNVRNGAGQHVVYASTYVKDEEGEQHIPFLKSCAVQCRADRQSAIALLRHGSQPIFCTASNLRTKRKPPDRIRRAAVEGSTPDVFGKERAALLPKVRLLPNL